MFTRVSVDGVLSNEPLYFYIASIKKLLQHILSTCKGYAAEVQKCLQRDPAICFDIVMYNDEAQGGNLLSPNSGKKASLWYFCLRQVEWRWCDVVWHPLCLIPHNDFDKAAGGFSAITRKIFRTIMEEELHLGFPVSLPNCSTLLKWELKWVISDLDSIRAALSLKGSAGIRCCAFCRNAVKKNAGLEEFSDYFQDITSSDIHKFDEQTDADIFEVWDHLLHQKGTMTQKKIKKRKWRLDSTFLKKGFCQTAWFAKSCLPGLSS